MIDMVYDKTGRMARPQRMLQQNGLDVKERPRFLEDAIIYRNPHPARDAEPHPSEFVHHDTAPTLLDVLQEKADTAMKAADLIKDCDISFSVDLVRCMCGHYTPLLKVYDAKNGCPATVWKGTHGLTHGMSSALDAVANYLESPQFTEDLIYAKAELATWRSTQRV